MRFALLPLLAILAVGPAFGQETMAQANSPRTSTTEDAPEVAAPARTAGAATHHRRRTAKQRFDEANTTHDGKLTLDQAQTAKMGRVAKNFDAIDTGHKGYVTLAQIKAYNKAQRAARKSSKS